VIIKKSPASELNLEVVDNLQRLEKINDNSFEVVPYYYRNHGALPDPHETLLTDIGVLYAMNKLILQLFKEGPRDRAEIRRITDEREKILAVAHARLNAYDIFIMDLFESIKSIIAKNIESDNPFLTKFESSGDEINDLNNNYQSGDVTYDDARDQSIGIVKRLTSLILSTIATRDDSGVDGSGPTLGRNFLADLFDSDYSSEISYVANANREPNCAIADDGTALMDSLGYIVSRGVVFTDWDVKDLIEQMMVDLRKLIGPNIGGNDTDH
jgi:hypothetical protein